ncbi:hypothetical protein LTR08_004356 [Meristemomyces frigidus]|nr:hypothetical protein LTR08_004356 [Meristemomyces frigidus]
MLSIKRPTPTTVLYTVSTRDPPQTLVARTSTRLIQLARLLASIALAILLLHETCLAFPPPTTPPSPTAHGLASTIQALRLTPPLPSLTHLLAAHTTRLWRVLTSLGLAYLINRKTHTTESLLVIRGLGVQTSTSSPSYLWTSSTRFIPTSSIQDVFIHEAFKGFECRFYLCIVVEGEGEVVVVFPTILPRRSALEQIWRGTRACLYEPKT